MAFITLGRPEPPGNGAPSQPRPVFLTQVRQDGRSAILLGRDYLASLDEHVPAVTYRFPTEPFARADLFMMRIELDLRRWDWERGVHRKAARGHARVGACSLERIHYLVGKDLR
jgi:hypothetical protein